MNADPHVLNDHVRHARETLEGAQTSIQAAQKAFEQSGDQGAAAFLQEAQTAYDDARSAYDLAVIVAQGAGRATPAADR